LTWRYLLLETTPESASVLASKAVMKDIEFLYQRHHEDGRSMFRVLEGDFKTLRGLAESAEVPIKEAW